MDLRIIADAFVVVVVGGMGSVAGAFLAALLIGELTAFGIWVFPQITLVLTFLIMAVVLVVRPWGLLGRPELAAKTRARPGAACCGRRARARGSRPARWCWRCCSLPAVVGGYAQFLLIEIFCLALFATEPALHHGPGRHGLVRPCRLFRPRRLWRRARGQASRGADERGAGDARPLVALAGALLFGWFCVRLSGVYLAMLSLAFAQIVYAIVFQWYEFTGGDNGLVGIWPAPWASCTIVYYYLALALNLCALLLLRRIVFAPFGMTLRACRDAPLRADAIGIDIRTHQWLAFTIAGTFAGLSGGILAFLKGTIDPTWLAIPQSIEGLVMVLLGGVQTLAGPIVGAAAYHGLEIEFATVTRYWPLVLGAIIVVLVLAFPQGIVGFAQASARRAGRGQADGGARGRGPAQGLWRRAGGGRRRLRARGRRASGADRAERRRQDHLLQLPERPDPARCRQHPPVGAASSSACRRAASGAWASAAPSRSPRPSAR